MTMHPKDLAAELDRSVTPGQQGEFGWSDALELGAFSETALEEADALDSFEGVDQAGCAVGAGEAD